MSRYIDADLISRQDAIDALERIFNRCEEIETHLPDGDPDKTGYKMFPDYMIVWKYLRQLPSAQQWIPCSERLPEKPKNYPHCEIRRTWFLVSLESGCVKSLAYEFDRDEWQVTGSPVLAWMPLPEPWKGEANEQIH